MNQTKLRDIVTKCNERLSCSGQIKRYALSVEGSVFVNDKPSGSFGPCWLNIVLDDHHFKVLCRSGEDMVRRWQSIDIAILLMEPTLARYGLSLFNRISLKLLRRIW